MWAKHDGEMFFIIDVVLIEMEEDFGSGGSRKKGFSGGHNKWDGMKQTLE